MKDFYNKKYSQIKRKTPLSEYEIHVSKHVSNLFMRVFNGIFMILFYNYFAKTTNTHNYFNLNLSSEYLANIKLLYQHCTLNQIVHQINFRI